MFSEKVKKAPCTPEITDLAPITADNEQPCEADPTSAKSRVRGCLQVLGAFFIFFNVWYVNPQLIESEI
jgi:hypothetical protein